MADNNNNNKDQKGKGREEDKDNNNYKGKQPEIDEGNNSDENTGYSYGGGFGHDDCVVEESTDNGDKWRSKDYTPVPPKRDDTNDIVDSNRDCSFQNMTRGDKDDDKGSGHGGGFGGGSAGAA